MKATAIGAKVVFRGELQSGKEIKAVHTDRGGEYVNEVMTTLLEKILVALVVKSDGMEHKLEQNMEGNPSKGLAFSVIEGVAANDWLVDAGSLQYLTVDKSLSETVEMFGGSGREFLFGDKGTLWAEGSGSVKLLCATSTEDCLVTLQNVVYVSGVAADLIPVSKATAVALVLFKETANFPMKQKSEVAKLTEHLIKRLELQTGKKLSERCVFVGYEPDFKAYRVLGESDGRIMISWTSSLTRAGGQRGC
ncbi:hypothetical protein KFL_014110010 [Klebsormidium nitens]|uniref:Retrovirus-related Pol polyprotein from transposon TNT 1-94-like beta-barrel domain-containing protein n=1 Tax=Klebsormidium nitens TaxID=105231 RepID=A0A1Y1IY90_KLENI|nr:hypothetical protein KFL_014110010 [Klebsormidium nitens]|eukprot:GAQ93278.1 hypothetical protein KFL_014110010 [Klebsormidium nitens]